MAAAVISMRPGFLYLSEDKCMKFSQEFIDSLMPFFPEGHEIYSYAKSGDALSVWRIYCEFTAKLATMRGLLFDDPALLEAIRSKRIPSRFDISQTNVGPDGQEDYGDTILSYTPAAPHASK